MYCNDVPLQRAEAGFACVLKTQPFIHSIYFVLRNARGFSYIRIKVACALRACNYWIINTYLPIRRMNYLDKTSLAL